MSDTERDDLVRALAEAIKANNPFSLLAGQSERSLELTKAAIEASPSFKAIEDKHVYSAHALFTLQPVYLARNVYYRGDTAEEKADWLLKVMRTTVADGHFIAAIWGIEPTATVQLSRTARLMPFADLPESPARRRLMNRAARYKALSQWHSEQAFQSPSAAYVEEIKDVPYISSTPRAAELVTDSFVRAVRVWPLIELLGAGQPLVFAHWFEYVDEMLDVSSFENYPSFYHSEVAPRVHRPVTCDVERLRADLVAFEALPEKTRDRLRRSANRFSLSLCRYQIVDRTLDLGVAFETMLTGQGESNVGIGWKLAVRCAQLLGGELENRLRVRKRLGDFYNYRSRATHGSNPKVEDEDVEAATELFKRTFRALIRLGREPKWDEIEMEPPKPSP